MPICLKFAAPWLLGEVMKVTGMVMVPTPEPWMVMFVVTVPAPWGARDWLTQIGKPRPLTGKPPGAGGWLSTPVEVRLPKINVWTKAISLKDAQAEERDRKSTRLNSSHL